MGVIRRQGIKSTMVSYSGVVLGAINTLWVYPSFLTAEEIGLITLIISISLIIAPISQLGASGITIKYYPYVKGDKRKEASLIYLTFLLPTIGFSIAMLLLFYLKGHVISSFEENSPLFNEFLFALVPFTFLFAFRKLIENISRTQLLVAMPSFFKEFFLRILIVILVLIYYFMDLPLSAFIYGYVGMLAVSLILLIIYTYRLGVLKFNFSLAPFEKPFVKQMIAYGLFVIFSGFVNNIITRVDGYMISSMIDLSNNGIYTIALYIGVAVAIPKQSIILISMPIISREFKNNNIKEVESLYKKSAMIQLIIGCILLICIWIGIDDLFKLIPNGDIYQAGKFVVLFIGLATLIDMATGVNNEIIFMSDFYRYFFVIICALIAITIINNLWLIPIYGITGAAMATAITVSLFNILKYLLIYQKLGIQPFTKNTLKVALLAATTLLIGLILPNTDLPLVNIAYKSILLLTFYSISIYYFKVSEDVNGLITDAIKKLRTLK